LKIIFIRHGNTDYALANERKMSSIEENFIPLSEKGRKQVDKTATDPRLKKAKAIISSPYTRALQSAAILNRELRLPLYVEFDLHEWKYDIDGTRYIAQKEIDRRIEEFLDMNGDYCSSDPKPWEKKVHVEERAIKAIAKYARHVPIIVVSHGMLISCLTNRERLPCAAVLEYEINVT
jgi:broad specificity phosphatase PhoE